ncbi:copper resistance CopC family protein [Nocardioides litoris]|uniref:copper resistance CopC family protein n=1 Tax=Nocardioides litoris TaxID=1926648 RepID=UPI001476CE0A|nr:copper resistance CopC family protein [Nocardioides litoris]
MPATAAPPPSDRTSPTGRGPGRGGGRGVLRLLLAALLLVGSVLAGAAPAVAHEGLISSDPAEAGVVEELPSRAVLTFSGPPREVHELSLVGPEGSVTNGAATLVGAEVRQNLWAGPDGEYVLAYDVLSSDGHEVAGEVRFEVGPVSGVGASAPAADVAPAAARPGFWERRRGALVPIALVVLAGAAAVLVLRRSRSA